MTPKRSKYRLVWELTAGERLRYLAAVAALVIASGLLYLAPFVPTVVLDGVLAEDAAASPLVRDMVARAGGAEFLRANLWLAAVSIAALATLAGGFTYLRGRWSALASERIARRLRDRLYDHLQRLPAAYFDRAQTGDLVQRCTSDVDTLRLFLGSQVVEIGRAVLMLLLPLPLMAAVDPGMTVLALVLISPILAFSIVFFRRVHAQFKAVDEAEGRLTSTIQENLTGIRVVRAFARQDYEIERFAARNREHQGLHYGLFRLLAGFWSVSDLLCLGQMALIVVAGGLRLAEGTLGVGGFFFFLMAVNMFVWPVRMMGRILAELGKAVVAIGRIQEVLDHPVESAPAAPAAPDDEAGGWDIVFREVTFAHGEGRPALDAVSFRIPAGRTVALAGPSGAGKSTIVNLLLRLYDPEAGAITVNGRDIRELPREAVRRRISTVMQEPFLYSKTLRDNIRLSRSAAPPEDIAEAARAARIHDTILGFERGYDTRVGERGITLSGGQRQRVALARALLRQPALLILDDALSAVDTETEAVILEALRRRRGRQTTLVIAHRLTTLMDADEIVVLDAGRVVERGAHDELKDRSGLYGRLWRMQNAADQQVRAEAERSSAPEPGVPASG